MLAAQRQAPGQPAADRSPGPRFWGALAGLPGAGQAALDRQVRATDRLTRQAADHKRRIKDLARHLLPLSPLAGDLRAADLAVLQRYADPRALARAGQARLAALITKASRGHQGAERARLWLDAARPRWTYMPTPGCEFHRPGRRDRPAARGRPMPSPAA
jgi:hypothetical protein